jgi:hypothetical protein
VHLCRSGCHRLRLQKRSWALTVVLAGQDAAALERAHRSLHEHDQRRAMTVQMDVTPAERITAAPALTAQVRGVNVMVTRSD